MFTDDGTDVSLLNDPTLITEGEGETRDQLEHKERACESHCEDSEGNREVARGQIEETASFEDSAHPGHDCQ
jgi:hypothetical protein